MGAKFEGPMRAVTLNMLETDCQWLEKLYGDSWVYRMEQHIASEVELRRQDGEVIKDKPPWNY
jgi:hypothetical protein